MNNFVSIMLMKNYKNEFNNNIFKQEQIEYNKENINWRYINFPNNEECVKLIDGKMGIFVYLDEECIIPEGNDINLFEKLSKKFKNNDYFTCSKSQYVNKKFVINHYPGSVTYDINNFCNKNKNVLNNDLINLLLVSKINIFKSLNKFNTNFNKIKSQSISNNFIKQLNFFLHSIKFTTPHYVRCLKPNDFDQKNNCNKIQILDQLRFSGILETVKILRAGYSIRIKYENFYDNFYMIMDRNNNQESPNSHCKIFFNKNFKNMEDYQIGLSKIFLKKHIFQKLENQKLHIINFSSIIIQSNFKCYIYRKKWLYYKKCVINSQSYIRRFLAIKFVYNKRKLRAIIKIQKNVRKMLYYKKYNKIRNCVIQLQCLYRYKKFVFRCRKKLQHKSILIIQKTYRMYIQKKKFRKYVTSIVIIQSLFRKKIAIKICNDKKKYVKTLKYIKWKNLQLENKYKNLQEKNKLLLKEKQNKIKNMILEEKNKLLLKEKQNKIKNMILQEKNKQLLKDKEKQNYLIDEFNVEKNILNDKISIMIQKSENDHITKNELAEKINRLLIEKSEMNEKLYELRHKTYSFFDN